MLGVGACGCLALRDCVSWGALVVMAPRVGYGGMGYLELILVFV